MTPTQLADQIEQGTIGVDGLALISSERRMIVLALRNYNPPRMQAAWQQMRAFEKKYHVGMPSQSALLMLDLIEFYPERSAYILACDEFYKASREVMNTLDSPVKEGK